MATTHKEVYRRFEGSLDEGGPVFWPILTGGIRVSMKRKLPLLLLYIVPFIATCVVSFLVYLKCAAEESVIPEAFGGQVGFAAQMVARQATTHLEARNQIIGFHQNMNMFALLCVAWYGSGLLCDDRRSGAYQLYFSRPLARWSYFLGKLLTVGFFGLLVSFVPSLIVFLVASLASPEWAFLTSEWDMVPRSLAFSLTWLGLTCGVTLLASACASRKSFALLAIFFFFGFSTAVGAVLGGFVSGSLYASSVAWDMHAIAHHIFDREENWRLVEPPVAWAVVASLTALAFAAIAARLSRLEVVE